MMTLDSHSHKTYETNTLKANQMINILNIGPTDMEKMDRLDLLTLQFPKY